MSSRIVASVLVALTIVAAGSVAAQISSEESGAAGTVVAEEAEASSVSYPLTEERREQLESYAAFNHVWRFVSLLVGLGILALIVFTGFSSRMRTWASRIVSKRFLSLWLFTAMLIVAYSLLDLPFSIYRGFIVEQNYGFVNQGFWEWLGEETLGMLVLMVIAIIPVGFFYWCVRRFRHWWLVFTAGALPIMVFFVVIAPVLISPLFNDFQPLTKEPLRSEIVSLASEAGIGEASIFEVDASKQSSKINAYVTGLFGTKRIVLYDTLIRNFTSEEIRFVMAHEMGHYVMNHVWWGVFVGVVLVGLALWLIAKAFYPVVRRYRGRLGFDSLSDHASLPLVLLMALVINFFFQPIGNAVSRTMERQADVYGLETSGVPAESAVRSFDKLSVFNLSDPDPPAIIEFWFYSHPSLKKRMAFAKSYRAGK